MAAEITRRNLSAGALLCNFISHINHSEGSNFYSLYGLPPQRLNALRQHRLGQFPEQQQTDLEWLQRIPKAELHCHLGGILTPREIIAVAEHSQTELADLCRQNPDLAAWQEQIRASVSARDTQSLRFWFKHKDELRRAVKDVPEPFCLIAFVLAFQKNPDLLERLIYHDYPDEVSFQGIGIENYERLGDLQGSGLLQNENCLRAACQILIRYCLHENITYLELRCSPVNYTRGGLSGEKVTEILLQELQPCRSTHFSLLFIASRHGRMSDVYRQIELTAAMLDHPTLGEDFRHRFVGFDLAGAEHSRSTRELREAFSSLHKRCLNITIHAGETAPADSVWEAVYFLNADRIGHGLTLEDNPNLINLILNRRIAIEMCPSSNFQICSFWDAFITQSASNKTYPLQKYLQQGLRVSICTDNPGISSTTLSREYLKAARLCPGGLSQWDTLRLCRNAFQASFAPFAIRREILRKAEKHISEILEKNDY
ncbi:MAG: hypothetical protein GX564_13025 [Oligosphaeraceae bacterium]|nr:hypothetical protein [Oligosphaeraceae bacterium]